MNIPPVNQTSRRDERTSAGGAATGIKLSVPVAAPPANFRMSLTGHDNWQLKLNSDNSLILAVTAGRSFLLSGQTRLAVGIEREALVRPESCWRYSTL